MVNYKETKRSIPQKSHIGLPIPVGGKTIVACKDMTIEEVQ